MSFKGLYGCWRSVLRWWVAKEVVVSVVHRRLMYGDMKVIWWWLLEMGRSGATVGGVWIMRCWRRDVCFMFREGSYVVKRFCMDVEEDQSLGLVNMWTRWRWCLLVLFCLLQESFCIFLEWKRIYLFPCEVCRP